ncbi:VOC family protein [Glycomyces sp. L485]|uniref:VOC family protein n=1 Tax=Glycomyces sp. L485 TaxID=2909235 RepID=UPI001F4B6EE2|nr:VOC family protein [Glycomyces sp. L485]MCH7229976.1 VOC family protein [Glycomyces sp. L485]
MTSNTDTTPGAARVTASLLGIVIPTRRFDKMLEFYADALGLPVEQSPVMVDGSLAALLNCGAAVIELHEVPPYDDAGARDALAPRLAIHVHRIDPARLSAHGAAVVDQPRTPDTTGPAHEVIACTRDPDGRLVQLHQLPPWPATDTLPKSFPGAPERIGDQPWTH